MPGWFCRIRLIHLIGQKSFHFEIKWIVSQSEYHITYGLITVQLFYHNTSFPIHPHPTIQPTLDYSKSRGISSFYHACVGFDIPCNIDAKKQMITRNRNFIYGWWHERCCKMLKPPPLQSTHIQGVESRIGSMIKHWGMRTRLMWMFQCTQSHYIYW